MKVCFWGLGSIGKRHLKNIVNIFKDYNLTLEIHALRKTKTPLCRDTQSLIDYEFFNEEELHTDYDITFITNPTNLHFDSIKFMENRTKNMFIEKPIFDNSEYNIDELNLKSTGVYYVAGPLKFTPVIQNLRKVIKNEKVYCIRAICSSYLPDWRKGVDYRTIYSAKKSEGGGVSIDLIHEWDYIVYLCGFPIEVFNLNGKYSHLEIDSEDISIYIAKYEDKLVEVHLDYFGKQNRRQIEIFTQNATIVGDFINNTISFSDGRKQLDLSRVDKDMYIEEMKNFINSVLTSTEGKSNIENAYKILKLATGRGIE